MAYWLSKPVEALIEEHGEGTPYCDVLVVGSGYGGSVAAMRLAGPGRTVILFERGREYALGDFPEDLGELPGHVRFQRPEDDAPVGNSDALFDFRLGERMSALVGNGLGGGSLINANVAIEPDDQALNRPEWPKELRTAEGRAALRKSMRR